MLGVAVDYTIHARLCVCWYLSLPVSRGDQMRPERILHTVRLSQSPETETGACCQSVLCWLSGREGIRSEMWTVVIKTKIVICRRCDIGLHCHMCIKVFRPVISDKYIMDIVHVPAVSALHCEGFSKDIFSVLDKSCSYHIQTTCKNFINEFLDRRCGYSDSKQFWSCR